jgi:thioredoxin 1
MSDLTREKVDQMEGPVVLEFGASWCPHCQAIRKQVASMLKRYPEVEYINIEDGPGKRLGRTFRVKLWPTLVFLRDGQIVRQEVRPSEEEIAEGFAELAAGQ